MEAIEIAENNPRLNTGTYLPSDPHLAGPTSIYMSNYLTSKTSLKTSICGDTNLIPSIIIIYSS